MRIGFVLLAASLTLQAQQTSTVLTTPSNTLVFGQPVTLTATVTPSPSAGRVTFYDGAVMLGTSAVASGKATYTTSLLATGARSLRAYYGGAGSFSASTSSNVGVTVMSLTANGFLPTKNFTIGGSGPAVVGDFNGDGKADIAVPGVSVLLGNGDGTFKAPVNSPEGGGQLAVGDFNGDGKSDLAFINNSGVGIMLGNGDGTFQTAVTNSTGNSSYGLVVGDFNSDGKADIATVSGGSVVVFLGDGDGTLQSAATYATGTIPDAIVAADFNGDGKVDLAVAGIILAPGPLANPVISVRILLGNGDGTFQSPTTGFTTPPVPQRLVAGDFNGDGIVDLATSNSTGSISVLLGIGDGTFQAAVNYGGSDGTALAVSDINGDGKQDLVFPTFIGAAGVLYGNGDGTFQFGLSFGIPSSNNSVAVADFNGDGKADLAFDINTGLVTVLLGEVRPLTSTTLTSSPNPSKLGQPVTLTALVSPSSLGGVVTFYDGATQIGSNNLANGQATLTLNSLALGTHSLTASYPGDTQYVASISPVVTQTVSGALPVATVTLSPSASVVTFGQALKLTAGISAASATGSVTFYDGTSILGTRAVASGQASMLTSLLSSGAHTLTARYNGDNSNAPATSSTVAETVIPVPGFGFGSSTLYPTGVAASFAVAVGDFNGDGKMDLVTANPNNPSVLGTISILIGKGDGTFQPAVNYQSGTYTLSVATGDFNGDGKMDVVAATAEGVLYVFPGNGDGTLQTPVPYSLGLVSAFVTVADVNGDGKPDLIASGNANAGAKILFGNGDGSFQPPVTTSGPVGQLVAVADMNGDGKPDLLSYSSVALGNGDGTFKTAQSFNPGSGANGLAIGDFNRDGKPDLAITLGSGPVVVMLGNGDGTFQLPVSYPGGAGPEGLAAADLDGDGKLDLVIADLYGGVTILLGQGDGTFAGSATLPEPNGGLAVAVGDFNGDGRADFAVANHAGGVNVFVNLVASQLQFTSIPTNGMVGRPLLPITVQVLDAGGNPFNASSAPVTLTSTPAGVSATVTAVNGVASFSGIIINTPGVYTLTATSPGAQPLTSGSFSVTGSVPSVAIDYPSPGAILASETFVVTGWAIDSTTQTGTPINSVKVLLDGTVVGTAAYGLNRPDVCNVYPQRPGCPNVGYSYSLYLPPGNHTITVTATDSDAVPDTGSASIAVKVLGLMPATKVGIFRNNSAFLEDSIGEQQYDPGQDRYFTTFSGPGGFVAGDIPVTGDWTGDGHTKVGIFRSSTGQWFLDANNDFILDAGDYTYGFGGLAGDMPIVGDWMGTGKSCIGIYRPGGSVWLLDLNCNGVFEGTPTDAFFPFGGLAGDVPVVGAWTGGATRVGVVRKYAPGGVPQGNPFLWVPDTGAANAGNLPANHPTSPNAFGFGGLPGDVFVTGDWYNTGVSTAGVYRAGFWVLDAALPGAPQANHVPGLTFGFGGVAGDVPLTGKW